MKIIVLVFASTFTVVLHSKAQNINGQQIRQIQDSVIARTSVMTNTCQIETARIRDVQSQLISLEQTRLNGIRGAKSAADKERISSKLLQRKMKMIYDILPMACVAALGKQTIDKMCQPVLNE